MSLPDPLPPSARVQHAKSAAVQLVREWCEAHGHAVPDPWDVLTPGARTVLPPPAEYAFRDLLRAPDGAGVQPHEADWTQQDLARLVEALGL